MKKAIMTVGISASGKTTWAKKYVDETPLCAIVCRDDIRQWILDEKRAKDPKVTNQWKMKWEKECVRYQEKRIRDLAEENYSIVIADTNLNKKTVDRQVALLESLGYEVEFKYFPISYEEAVKRDAKRCNGVGAPVIAQQLELWNDMMVPKFKPDRGAKEFVVIVDLDGTLARMNGRGPYEWDRVGEDIINEPVADMVYAFSKTNHIIFLSGRDGICYKKTEEWLEEELGYAFIHDSGAQLLMRAKGDTRPDVEVKYELFTRYIEPYYNVYCVIDDRPKVCRMWRSLGLFVIQIGNPHIEF